MMTYIYYIYIYIYIYIFACVYKYRESAKVRYTEPVLSTKEVEEHIVDVAVFRSWCPLCVKGRAVALGHKRGQPP
jgi:hypothetical protein